MNAALRNAIQNAAIAENAAKTQAAIAAAKEAAEKAAAQRVEEALGKVQNFLDLGYDEERALWYAMSPVRGACAAGYREVFVSRGWKPEKRDVSGMNERPRMAWGWVSPTGRFFRDDN